MILYIAVTAITVIAACLVCGRRETASCRRWSAGDDHGCERCDDSSSGGSRRAYNVGTASPVLTRRSMLNRISLIFIFLILFMLSALRFGMGDYWKYVEFMHLIKFDSYVPTEWGFNLLVRIIYGLSGFENYKLVFAIYSFLTVFFFMKAMYDQSADFKLSFFMFMTLGLYFQSFCTMRYYLALAIALWSIKLLQRKQYVVFVAAILLASGFHKSVLVVLPIFLLAIVPWKKWMITVFAVFSVSLIIGRDFWMKVAVTLYPTYKETSYASDGGSISPANIARCVAILLFTLYVMKRSGNKRILGSFMSKLNIMALVIYSCCWYIPFVSRIGYYMTVTQILFVPELIMILVKSTCGESNVGENAAVETSGSRVRRRAVILVVIICMMYFAMYLKRAYSSSVNVLPYRTFLFEDSSAIVQEIS